MAQFGGLQGLGGPIDYFGMVTAPATQALNDSYRNDALEANTAAQWQQTRQAQAEQLRRQSFYDAIGSATPEQLPALRRQFPEFAQNIQQEIGVQGAEHAAFVHSALNNLSVAAASGNPDAVQAAIQKSGPALASLGVSPEQAAQLYQQDPQQFNGLLNATRLATLPADKQFDVQQNQQKIDETARSNRAGEALQGQQIAVSRENSMRSSGGQTPASVREYQYFNSLSPEQQKTYLRVKGRNGSEGLQQAQLSNGETVMIEPKPRGAGANMFYPGIDANGNVISVPVSSLAATSDASSSTNQNLVSSDLAKITGATPDQLSVLTGFTGGIGENPITSDIRTRLGDKETRDIFRAAQRVQGYMLKQGVSDAKNMGASGINTADEAKMYFQAAPQLDYSSPEALVDSGNALDEYTRSFNSRHNVNYKKGSQQPAKTQQQAPSAAIQALQANPSLAPQFKAKYGYLP